MKITVLSTVHRLEDNRIFFKEIQSLRKRFEIIFVVTADNKKPFLFNDVKIEPLPKTNNFFSRLIINQIRAYRKLRKLKTEVLHFHDPELILLAWILKKFFGLKVIFDVHENVYESLKKREYIPPILRNIVANIYSFIEKILIKDFDAIIIAETSYRKIYGQRAIEILNYPIVRKKDLQKDFNGRINFAYVGGISQARCVLEMIEIFRSVLTFSPHSRFYMIGPFVSKEIEEKVKNTIEKFNLQNNVILTGFIPISKAYSFLEKSHIGFSLMKPLENYRESLSTKIFDYMANKMTYFVSDFPIYDKYARQNKTGFAFNCQERELILKKIKELLDDRNLLEKFALKGFTQVNLKWNWSSQEKKLFNLYESIKS